MNEQEDMGVSLLEENKLFVVYDYESGQKENYSGGDEQVFIFHCLNKFGYLDDTVIKDNFDKILMAALVTLAFVYISFSEICYHHVGYLLILLLMKLIYLIFEYLNHEFYIQLVNHLHVVNHLLIFSLMKILIALLVMMTLIMNFLLKK